MKKSLWAIFLAVALVPACAPLKHISEFSAASAKTMEDRSVANGFTAIKARRAELFGTVGVPVTPSPVQKELVKIQSTYSAYFKALGSLAANDLADYSTQYAAFEKSLGGSGVVTKSEAGAISAVGKSATSLAVDLYRHRKISEITKTVNPAIQRNLGDLRKITARYKEGLDDEEQQTNQTFQIRIKQADGGTGLLLRKMLSGQQAVIASERQRADAFDLAVEEIAKGHQKLTDQSSDLSAEDLKAALQAHKDQISKAYQALNP
jgi:hypothetical protein